MLTTLVSVFLAGYMLKPVSKPTFAPIEIYETSLAEFAAGDLVPCEKEEAEFVLSISCLKTSAERHMWREYFCIYDGSNTDPSSNSTMHGAHSITCGDLGSVLLGVELVRLGPSALEIDFSCHIIENGTELDFSSSIHPQLNAKGIVTLEEDSSIAWDFNAVDANDR
ncbi:hypothetical protein [Mariniblastus fucicola]|uniref:Uncharacterized protein n=1 Tax=Mariniblastus fucicola TaxID=980251 RepID=A0A5B9P9P0_9BACT|nr:hypothetical protein [Mariniblastus fucicola]QEG21630.1 hypothetical protein MFFC18_14880 [Mariniblastus fucicola]